MFLPGTGLTNTSTAQASQPHDPKLGERHARPHPGNKGPESNGRLRLNRVQAEQQTEWGVWPEEPHFCILFPTSTLPQTGLKLRGKQTDPEGTPNFENGTTLRY